jgi:hypothetical protein
MKKLKLILVLFAAFTVIFQSCSSSDDVAEPQKSAALRIYLKEMKSAFNISGRTSSADPEMCFEFVYPITLSYNNGTTIVVTNENELISILENESSDLYIDGISFPFDILVAGSNTPVTIANEDDFWNAIENCDIDTYDDSISGNDCFTFVYPFSLLTNNNQTIAITNENTLLDLLEDINNDNYIIDFVYPFSVVFNNETVQIDNAFEFEELIYDCNSLNCPCPDVYEPVCVNIDGETIEFPNACTAECAGFTSADFVDCGDNNNNNSFEDVLENCLNISYPVQVQFNGAVATAQNDSQLLQLYNPSQNQIPAFIYPITVSFENIPNFTYTVNNHDSMMELILELDCD